MSATATLVTQQHFDYIASHTKPEDDFLARLKQAARVEGIPEIWICPEQASFMQILLQTAKTREVIEVGTLAGYSAIAMARALPVGGSVRTIELNPKHADFAERWIAQSDVAGKIKVLRGTGADILATVADNSVDAAFLDADKGGYPQYLHECLRIVRVGGLIMVDNAFAFGELFDDQPKDHETAAVRKFNEFMSAEKRLQGVIVPLGDGLWVATRVR